MLAAAAVVAALAVPLSTVPAGSAGGAHRATQPPTAAPGRALASADTWRVAWTSPSRCPSPPTARRSSGRAGRWAADHRRDGRTVG